MLRRRARVVLGDAGFRIQDFVRIAELDAGDRSASAPCARLALRPSPMASASVPSSARLATAARLSVAAVLALRGFRCSRRLALRHFSVSTARSRITSFGFLSSRNPWNDGWRSVPSLVHSVNSISADELGLDPVRAFGLVSARRIAERRAPSFRALSAACAAIFSVASLKPVPTLPE